VTGKVSLGSQFCCLQACWAQNVRTGLLHRGQLLDIRAIRGPKPTASSCVVARS